MTPSAARGFRVLLGGHVLVGDILVGEEPPRLLLHGAGAPPAGTAGGS